MNYLALICMATKSFAYQLSFNDLMVPFPSDDKDASGNHEYGMYESYS